MLDFANLKLLPFTAKKISLSLLERLSVISYFELENESHFDPKRDLRVSLSLPETGQIFEGSTLYPLRPYWLPLVPVTLLCPIEDRPRRLPMCRLHRPHPMGHPQPIERHLRGVRELFPLKKGLILTRLTTCPFTLLTWLPPTSAHKPPPPPPPPHNIFASKF